MITKAPATRMAESTLIKINKSVNYDRPDDWMQRPAFQEWQMTLLAVLPEASA